MKRKVELQIKKEKHLKSRGLQKTRDVLKDETLEKSVKHAITTSFLKIHNELVNNKTVS